MSEIYISSDELSVEFWRLAMEEGLAGKRVYFKTEHPGAPDEAFQARSKREAMVDKVIESHLHVCDCAKRQVDPDPRKVMSIQKLRHLFDCSTRTARRAVAEARIHLNLDDGYRYSSKKGCFIHETQTKRARIALQRKGRPGSGFVPRRDDDRPAQQHRNPKFRPDFQVRTTGE